MSEARERRRVIKALRRTPDAYIDLVQWLLDRRYAGTKRQARALILAGKVKADSHTLGKGEAVAWLDGKLAAIPTVMPHVPAALRERILVEGVEPTPPGRRVVLDESIMAVFSKNAKDRKEAGL